MKVSRAKRTDEQDHRSLALWAADCAERVLPYFEEKYPKDGRPRKAIEAVRAWTRGEIRAGPARAAAARDAVEGAPRAAARAAGQAAGVAHMPGHARHAAAYAAKAVTCAAAAAAASKERGWQYRHLPKRLRPVAFPEQG